MRTTWRSEHKSKKGYLEAPKNYLHLKNRDIPRAAAARLAAARPDLRPIVPHYDPPYLRSVAVGLQPKICG